MEYPKIPNPPPYLDPSNIIREVGFSCKSCGNQYLAYEESNATETEITCPTCNCNSGGNRLDYDAGLELDIEINQKRKRGEQPKNTRDISHYHRIRNRRTGRTGIKRNKTGIVKPELDKRQN